MGWRSDGAASGTVLTNKVMGDTPVTLYAVFRQIITVTYYNGNTTASSASGNRYYNNGAISNPSFTLNQVALSGWTVRGWSTNGTANSGITYNNGVAFTRDSNVTLFGIWHIPANHYIDSIQWIQQCYKPEQDKILLSRKRQYRKSCIYCNTGYLERLEL